MSMHVVVARGEYLSMYHGLRARGDGSTVQQTHTIAHTYEWLQSQLGALSGTHGAQGEEVRDDSSTRFEELTSEEHSADEEDKMPLIALTGHANKGLTGKGKASGRDIEGASHKRRHAYSEEDEGDTDESRSNRHMSTRRRRGPSADREQAAQGLLRSQTQTHAMLSQQHGQGSDMARAPATAVESPENDQGMTWLHEPPTRSPAEYKARELDRAHAP